MLSSTSNRDGFPHHTIALPPFSDQVVIVPGYGLAVAGAQYAIADTVKTLTKHGVKVCVQTDRPTDLLFDSPTHGGSSCFVIRAPISAVPE